MDIAEIATQQFGRASTWPLSRLLLLTKSAQERLDGFLLEMAARAEGAESIDLPMTRQDIADYLGLTIETMSRTLTALAEEAVIEVPSACRILLRDRAMLEFLNG